MSEENDFYLEEEGEVEGTLEVGFNEVKFEEIKIGFQEGFEEEEHEDLTDEDLMEFLSLGFVTDTFGIESFGRLDLEEALGMVQADEGDSGDGDFYKVKDEVGGVYDVDDGEIQGDYESSIRGDPVGPDEFVDIDNFNTSIELDDGRREERSMLEISGFRDEDAEKRRREKRERFW